MREDAPRPAADPAALPAPWTLAAPRPGRKRRHLPPRPGYDAAYTLRLYRDALLACQLAADLDGLPLAAWMRRALAQTASATLRRARRPPPRITEAAAAGARAERERAAPCPDPPRP